MITVLVGIDSYSFHRYFGEVYPQQKDPGKRWDMKDDFVPFAKSLEVDEVALETIFYPAFDDNYCAAIKDELDDAGLRRVIGWGHPDGLHRGQDADALDDLIRHIPRAEKVGACCTLTSRTALRSKRQLLCSRRRPRLPKATE
jgi:sugar phosphate isomerase/epimerase